MTTTPRNILLVDDKLSIRESLQRALSGCNFTVETAANGPEALERFAAGTIDLVLLDWNISNENGWEIFQQLTAINLLLPVIVITARPDQISPQMKAGIDAVLEKPLDLGDLVSTIDRLLKETAENRLSRMDRTTVSLSKQTSSVGSAPENEPVAKDKKTPFATNTVPTGFSDVKAVSTQQQ